MWVLSIVRPKKEVRMYILKVIRHNSSAIKRPDSLWFAGFDQLDGSIELARFSDEARRVRDPKLVEQRAVAGIKEFCGSVPFTYEWISIPD